jgi:hypothetical protein
MNDPSNDKIAETEIARKEAFGRTLDHICQQLEQLAILDVLPNDLEQRDVIINRALDVRSAAMLFLAIAIRYEATSFGIPGMANFNSKSLTL